MNNYENWAHLVAKKLKGEADVITAIGKDELDDAAATEAFVRTVLQPFLPESYGVGSGHIIDAYGNRSNHLDVIVYQRNFPRIRFSGTQSDYLYESVLAAFSIRAKYVRKTFFESMDACASLAHLETKADYNMLIQLAKRNGLKAGPNKSFVHDDPLRTTRFELIGRPPAFMFGFTGIQGSLRQLQENLELWIEQRQQHQLDTPMLAFPAVIATQGCFAWRNAAPLALSNREMLGLGLDTAPIRLIILQLLHLLNRRLNVTADAFGLKPNLGSYLSQFAAPEFELGVGDVDQMVALRPKPEDSASLPRAQPARDHALDKPTAETPAPLASAPAAPAAPATPAPAATAPAASTPAAPAAPAPAVSAPVASAPVASAPAASAPKATVTARTAAPEPVKASPATAQSTAAASSAGVFDKPSPFASAPAPVAAETKAAATQARRSAPVAPLGSAPIPSMDRMNDIDALKKPPAAPLGSAPIPSMDSLDSIDSLEKPPAAPLGSAPIPSMDSLDDLDASAKPPTAPLGSAPIPSAKPLAAVVQPKPSVDIELVSATKQSDESVGEEPIDFESTIIIAPDATLSTRKDPAKSTNAFIDRVKQQLTSGETNAPTKEDSFTTTVPH